MTTATPTAGRSAPPEANSREKPQPSPTATWTGRLGVVGLLITAPAATLYLSFSNGGYFPNAVGLVAICFCAALVLRTTLADQPFEGYTRALGVGLIALGLFALLQLISAAWSHTPAPALDDYDRTFLYVLVLALFGSLPRTLPRLVWLTRSLAVAMSLVCLAALLSRVLPHLWPTAAGFYADRLNYPLGYWNALGLMGAIACILLLHFTCSLSEPRAVRVAAAALFPIAATTVLLTYSRGALAVAVIGLVAYAVLGRPRGLLTGLVAIVPASVLALHSAYDAVLLSGDHPTSRAALAQGHHVAVIVGISIALAAGLRAALLVVDRWLARPHSPPAVMSRLPQWAVVAGTAAVIVVALVLAGAPGFVRREVNRFAVNQAPNVTQTRDRLTDPASNGRIDLWRVALHQFSNHVVVGAGAGTYQTYYAQHRTVDDSVTDTHSLYLQTLGEDGLVGLLLLVTALVCVIGVLIWRMRGPQRALYAALFAAALAWALANAADWDWQMPAVTLWLFAVGGLALSNRRSKVRSTVSNLNRTALAAGLLALAVAPLLIGFSYQRLRDSGAAFNAGNCADAKRKALSSISLMAVRPQAYEILAYCDLQQYYAVEGLAAMRKAVSYDQQNWETHYGLAIALAANGLDPLPEARLANRLNPLESIISQELRTFAAAGPQGWQRTAQAVLAQGLGSGSLSVSNL